LFVRGLNEVGTRRRVFLCFDNFDATTKTNKRRTTRNYESMGATLHVLLDLFTLEEARAEFRVRTSKPRLALDDVNIALHLDLKMAGMDTCAGWFVLCFANRRARRSFKKPCVRRNAKRLTIPQGQGARSMLACTSSPSGQRLERLGHGAVRIDGALSTERYANVSPKGYVPASRARCLQHDAPGRKVVRLAH
jgi:hypothetical protein